jgi:pantoate--beta-alanine ligase
MQVFNTIGSLQKALSEMRNGTSCIGFVPTMGALHEGHLSLVSRCITKSDTVVASIYVNPTQFNDPADLKNYPRNTEQDLALLESAGCNIAFVPDDSEMYPEPDTRIFDFGPMGSIMEGSHRPGHFNGVAQIVTKLFNIVQPDRAYFGQKDFQQLAIIRKLVTDMNYPIEIIACPIVREADGLAMSSRNQLLTPSHRNAAPLIYETLKSVKKMVGRTSLDEIKTLVKNTINSNPYLTLEYFQAVESVTLKPLVSMPSKVPVTACIAVIAGAVRLIDNIEFIS